MDAIGVCRLRAASRDGSCARLCALGCLALALLPSASWARVADLSEARLWLGSQHTRVLFDLSAVTSHKVFILSHPDRLVLDVADARLTKTLPPHDFAGSLVTGWRSAPAQGNGMRIVLDLARPATSKSFLMKSEHGYQLVVDLFDGHARSVLMASAAPVAAAANPPQQLTERAAIASRKARPVVFQPVVFQHDELSEVRHAAVRSPRQSAARTQRVAAPRPARPAVAVPVVVPVVVIDPGHGGKDPGASGPSGVEEKDVTLAVARKLAWIINQEPGMRALLTRRHDVFLPLRERMQFARRHKADLFVSIHADAYREMDASGSSVFVLSERGASSEAARWLAERENAADLVGGISLDDKDAMVASALIDMSQSGAIEASMDAASQVLGALRRVGNIHKQQVQFAGFAVLKSPDVPSVLVETAFLTNPDEEDRLQSSAHQYQLAQAIARGIRSYFSKHLPARTVLAEQEH